MVLIRQDLLKPPRIDRVVGINKLLTFILDSRYVEVKFNVRIGSCRVGNIHNDYRNKDKDK